MRVGIPTGDKFVVSAVPLCIFFVGKSLDDTNAGGAGAVDCVDGVDGMRVEMAGGEVTA